MNERRFALRFRLALPITVTGIPGLEENLHGQTRDISAWGVYFTINRRLEIGTRVNISILLPETVTDRTRVSIHGKLKVVRIEAINGAMSVGIAGRLENGKIVRPERGRITSERRN